MRRLFQLHLILFFLLLATSGILPCQLQAASDGTAGTDSTGVFTASLTIPNLVRITGVGDLNFGAYSGGSDPSLNERVCVYSNDPSTSGTYKVKISGDRDSTGGAGTAYYIRLTGAAVIPYSVSWNDEAADGGVALTAGSYLTAQTGANTTSSTCAGGNNANFQVSFTKDDILDRPAGLYTGVLTVLIAPGT